MDKADLSNYKVVNLSDYSDFTAQNLITLLEQHSISQKDLAQKTGVAESTISAIKNKKVCPTIDFLFSLKANFDISIDDFLTKYIKASDLQKELHDNDYEEFWHSSCKKYCGTYIVYYFDTSKYKGCDFATPAQALMYGVLRIHEEPSALNKLDFSCVAVLGISNLQTAMDLKNKLGETDISKVIAHVKDNHFNYSYFGKFELTEKHAFISLSHNHKDKALAIFHNVPGGKSTYNGGIGTINSVSRGRETMPTAQFIGIAREAIGFSSEEIHRNLLLNYPSFKTTDEADALIKLFKNLYLDSTEINDSLSEDQKHIIIKANLERLLRKSLERNVFRYAKISNRDDDDWYHALKNLNISENELLF